MSTLLKPCIECGDLTEQALCRTHRPPAPPKPPAKERGYDHSWRKLSARARKAQPFCLWCGATDDLQLDHTPEAWARKEAGKTIRLCDVRVLCGPCNREAGKAKPGRGQRTSEDRPEQVVVLPPTGRHLTMGEEGRTRETTAPEVRQSFYNTPGGYAQDAVGEPW